MQREESPVQSRERRLGEVGNKNLGNLEVAEPNATISALPISRSEKDSLILTPPVGINT